jgi:hypothetical protein
MLTVWSKYPKVSHFGKLSHGEVENRCVRGDEWFRVQTQSLERSSYTLSFLLSEEFISYYLIRLGGCLSIALVPLQCPYVLFYVVYCWHLPCRIYSYYTWSCHSLGSTRISFRWHPQCEHLVLLFSPSLTDMYSCIHVRILGIPPCQA